MSRPWTGERGMGWASPTRCLERRVDSSLIPGLLAGVPGTVVVLVTEAEGLLRERKAWIWPVGTLEELCNWCELESPWGCLGLGRRPSQDTRSVESSQRQLKWFCGAACGPCCHWWKRLQLIKNEPPPLVSGAWRCSPLRLKILYLLDEWTCFSLGLLAGWQLSLHPALGWGVTAYIGMPREPPTPRCIQEPS